MKFLTFLPLINQILSLVVLILCTYYVYSASSACGSQFINSCFHEHYFGETTRAIFFVFILYIIIFCLCLYVCLLNSQAKTQILEGYNSDKVKIISKQLYIISFFAILLISAISISYSQQKKLQDYLSIFPCDISDAYGDLLNQICDLQRSNNSYLDSGIILSGVFLGMHFVYVFLLQKFQKECNNRVTQVPSANIQMAMAQSNPVGQSGYNQAQINAMFALQPDYNQQQGDMMIGQNVEQQRYNYGSRINVKNDNNKSQQQIQIGEAVLL